MPSAAPNEMPPKDGSVFVWCAVGLLVAALVANEWVLGSFSEDGALEGSTARLIRIAQGGLVAAAGLTFLLRARLERLFEREDRAMLVLLILGIVLRVVVYPYLGPDNNDPHRKVVEYVVEHGWTPTAEEATLGFQPPLYYLMASPWALGGSAKVTQLFSLLLSIANLVLLHRLIRTTRLLSDPRSRCHAFAFAALLPQFLLFGLFVSNDALAFLVGSLIFGQFLFYIDRPTTGRLIGLGAGLGIGLLTKGTFTAFLPIAFVLVFVVGLRAGRSLPGIAATLALLGVTSVGIGCYKFVENYVHFGTPVVSNDTLEQAWVKHQQGTVQGLSSFVDIDVPRLVRYPFASEETRHSLPLLFYGTMWYSYIHESNFDLTRRHPYTLAPRVVYVTAILPSLLLALGFVVWFVRNIRLDRSFRAEKAVFENRLAETAIVGVLLLNLGTVLSWGIKHDAWSFFQSRLVFPAFLALALLLGFGFEALARRFPRLGSLVNVGLLLPWIASLAWLGLEIAGQTIL